MGRKEERIVNLKMFSVCSLILANLWIYSAALENETLNVTIGVILPLDNNYLFSVGRCVPAMNIGIQEAYSRGYLSESKVKFHIEYKDSKCSGTHAPLASFVYKVEELTDIFFGPVCDYSLAPVARYSLHWNMPVLTAGGFANDFAKKYSTAEYGTLTRVGNTYTSLTRSFRDLVDDFGWSKVKFIYNSDGQNGVMLHLCRLAVDAVVTDFTSANIKTDHHSFTPETLQGEEEEMLTEQIGSDYAGMF